MSDEDGLQIIELKIDGMHCDACIRTVKSALENKQGVESVDVSIGRAVVGFQQYLVSRTEIEKLIEQSGYAVNRFQERKRKSFFERMIESNKKEFGNKRPNCCDL